MHIFSKLEEKTKDIQRFPIKEIKTPEGTFKMRSIVLSKEEYKKYKREVKKRGIEKEQLYFRGIPVVMEA